ncbi:MAG: hypothetical protein U9O87_06130 [Verrucomicrobiota bacterium]|nr:hypothetical protein [Verrucomicrobiota bacterium]
MRHRLEPVVRQLFLEVVGDFSESRLWRIPCELHAVFDRFPRVFIYCP